MTNQTLNPDDIAILIREAERTLAPIAPLTQQLGDMSEVDAYRIQKINSDARIAAGERVVGRKIGLTSPAVQTQLGVDQPDFGTLFAAMSAGDNQPIALAGLIQPKVEGEIALVLGSDLTRERHTYADLFRAVDHAVAAIEVVDSRIEAWRIRYADTVADNGSSARFVLGSRPRLLRELDLFGCGMTLSQAGKTLVTGSGAACLGNPLNAAVWLADRMAREGTPLRAGDVVLTGALGPMVAVTTAGTFEVAIEGLGTVRATFA
jgi:2-keto-4-pentenoate hydratase